MSAWIVSRAHIDAITQAVLDTKVVDLDPTTIGRALWAENLRSVAHRYPGDSDGERPGPVDFKDADVDNYVFRAPSAKLTRRDLLIALGCWDYQSCEHPDFAESPAHNWVELAERELELAGAKQEQQTRVNGYEIGWGLEEEHVHVTVAR